MRYHMNGLRFYRYEDGVKDPKLLRLYRIRVSKKIYECIDLNDPKHPHVNVSEDELENQWVKLNPDAVMAFSIVKAKTNEGDDTKDVTIRLHRIRRNEEGGVHIDTMPYCICRQSVIDIFAMIQQNRLIAGMSISQATCPPELSYESTCAYSKMYFNVNVAFYLDDTLDDILECFDQKPFTDELANVKYGRDGFEGYCSTLRELALNNYFMLDVHTGLNIAEFPMFKEFNFDDPGTNKAITDYILSNKQEVPVKFYPMPYSKYIDLSDIERPYILIAPDSKQVAGTEFDKITLVAYDVSTTISFKDIINKGMSVKRAKREVMAQLGWT